MENTIDLFDEYSELPWIVRIILESKLELECTYAENDRLLKELAPYGYTFDYGLCGEAYGLKRIYNDELISLVELEGRVNVVSYGVNMACERVMVTNSVLYKLPDGRHIIESKDGVGVICDNLCDVYVDNPENRKLVRSNLISEKLKQW